MRDTHPPVRDTHGSGHTVTWRIDPDATFPIVGTVTCHEPATAGCRTVWDHGAAPRPVTCRAVDWWNTAGDFAESYQGKPTDLLSGPVDVVLDHAADWFTWTYPDIPRARLHLVPMPTARTEETTDV